MNKWVRIKKFCEETGETDDAVRSNIAGGHWPEGIMWRKSPNGRIYIHTRNFNKWVEGQVYAPQAKVACKSTSVTKESGAGNVSAFRQRRQTESMSSD